MQDAGANLIEFVIRVTFQQGVGNRNHVGGILGLLVMVGIQFVYCVEMERMK
jgi:hypothetical protein